MPRLDARSRSESDRHVRRIGGCKYIPRDGNPANLGDARLHVVDGPAFDQPRKVGWRQDIFTNGDRNAPGADLPRSVKILRWPNRLLYPFEIEFAQRRDG